MFAYSQIVLASWIMNTAIKITVNMYTEKPANILPLNRLFFIDWSDVMPTMAKFSCDDWKSFIFIDDIFKQLYRNIRQKKLNSKQGGIVYSTIPASVQMRTVFGFLFVSYGMYWSSYVETLSNINFWIKSII